MRRRLGQRTSSSKGRPDEGSADCHVSVVAWTRREAFSGARTVAYGPGAVTVRPFLSSADDDQKAALEIAGCLSRPDITLYSSQNGNSDNGIMVGAGERVLQELAARFDPGDASSDNSDIVPSAGGGSADREPAPTFRNRVTELQAVEDALNNPDRDHFWVVIAPPQLGKTWFLDRLRQRLERQLSGFWSIRLVDVKDLTAAERANAWALLRRMYGPLNQPQAQLSNPEALAAAMFQTGGTQVCLLDSAELLSDATIDELRKSLSAVHKQVDGYVQLALVVASRRDKGWLAVTPTPRLHLLPLTEFSEAVIREALAEIAKAYPAISNGEIQRAASLVYRLSEGLPALLARYLQWIRQHGWPALSRLDNQGRFDELVGPYVRGHLLSATCLVGPGTELTDGWRGVLELSLQALSPYRLFTAEHLRHHAAQTALVTAMEPLGLTVEQLWYALSRTDLLQRPQGEPWHMIDAPIRRLLCRYWYSSPELLSQAHSDAGTFVQGFLRSPDADNLAKDQAILLVESLWHEAQAVKASTAAHAEQQLLSLAADLVANLQASPLHSIESLRECAVEKMRADTELVAAVERVDGLFERLTGVIAPPG